jgi:DNA-binding transcriptional LysR family regulator
MQIESLKMFCDLAETKSFTRAAELNGVTQSAVSQAISTLERQLTGLMVERSRKHFRLTRDGQVLYEYSKQLLQEYGILQAKMREVKAFLSARIRLATTHSMGLHELPPYVDLFRKVAPDVEVQVELCRTREVYDHVLNDEADVGLVAYPVRESRLKTVALRKDRLTVICHPQHPFARLKSIKLKALSGQKFISFERDTPIGRALDKMFRHQGVSVEQVTEFDNLETVKQAVEIDAGVAIVPADTVSGEVNRQTLVAVPLEGNYFRPLAMLHKKSKLLPPAVEKFITLVKKNQKPELAEV